MSDFIEIPATKRSVSRRRPLYGVGINDANYLVCPKINGKKLMCPIYCKWHDMIKRCYSEKALKRNPTYIGCVIYNEWLIFSVFKSWMEKQDWKGKSLDKDIKVIGNKIYSPDHCLFVTQEINKLLNDHRSARGKFPQGVHRGPRKNQYIAACNVNGESKYLGVFATPNAASQAYKEFKNKVIIETARRPVNLYIRKYLLIHAKMCLD